MNDLATVGSVQTGAPAAGTGTALEGSTGGTADPFSGLETGAREWVGSKGYKTVADLATAAHAAESLIGRSVQLPDDKATPEDLNKFFNRLGRPEKPEGYEFKLPQGLPEGMPYDAEFAKSFKAAAHQAGIPAKQAAALHDWWVGVQGKAYTASVAEAKKVQDEATALGVAATQALEKAYGGARGSEQFTRNMDLAVRGLEGLDKIDGVKGLKQAFENAGLLSGGVILEPSIAIALTHVGKALFSEDALVTGGSGGGSGTNPFADATLNETLQMQMVAKDKEGARRLILAANKQPADWGIT